MRPLLLFSLALTTCTGIVETRTYAGPQTPLAGSCDAPSRATLTRRGTQIVLAPSSGTLTLAGEVTQSTVTAKTTLAGADKKPYALVFTGQLQGATIIGALVTPRCRYALKLELTED